MTSADKDLLEQSLTGYKEKIDTVSRATLTWDKDLIFVGRTERGHEIEFDAQDQWGCKPIEALLLSLAGCMGIDVVMFLQKMRIEVSAFNIDLVGERNPTPPQYYRTIEMALRVKAKGLSPQKMERAVSLSQAKYCSVYNSLRKDLEVKVRYVLDE